MKILLKIQTTILLILGSSYNLFADDQNPLLLAQEKTSEYIINNNLFLQAIIILLVVLIFGYGAKLLYHRKFEED